MQDYATSADYVYSRNFSRELNNAYKYNPYRPVPSIPDQSGAGVGQVLKKIGKVAGKVNDFVKDNKLVSKAGMVADITGTRGALDAASGGVFSQAVKVGKQAGYGGMMVKQKGCGKRKPRSTKPKKAKK